MEIKEKAALKGTEFIPMSSINSAGANPVKKGSKQPPQYQATARSYGSVPSKSQSSGVGESFIWRWVSGSGWGKDSAAFIFSVVGVMIATSTERIAFKMSVDRLTPYRFLLTEMVLLVSVFAYGLITVLKRGMTNQITQQMNQFPHSKLLTMALLDTIQFACLVCTGAGVTPTMTVILLHASTLAVVFGSRFLFPDRRYSDMQMQGVYFTAGAIVLSVGQQFYSLYHSGAVWGVTSSLIYVMAAALHGLSTLYKEKCIVEWMQPIDVHFLSSWLFLYQAIICLILAPAIYVFQSVTNNWVGFPISSMQSNLQDGWACFQGIDPLGFDENADDASGTSDAFRTYDTKYMDCEYSFWLVALYVISNIVVLECIDRILQTGNQLLGRATAGAVLFAFLTLGVYDSQTDVGQGIQGTTIGLTDIISIIFLLIGIELHGRDSHQSDGVNIDQSLHGAGGVP